MKKPPLIWSFCDFGMTVGHKNGSKSFYKTEWKIFLGFIATPVTFRIIRMDDPVSQLANYKLQLGQVEAALTADAQNEELLTLRSDLLEIIEITEQLIEETKQQV